MSNPDGVIVGNYRTSISGNDLNRQYHAPDTRLHPTVKAIKDLVASYSFLQDQKLLAFIDLHGHSWKKNAFIYGPYYALHNDRYLKMRILPKLLSENTEMFWYFACKFRNEKSKRKAAWLILWKEFNLMNSFTLEASFNGFINERRQTNEFNTQNFLDLGKILSKSIYDYVMILEAEWVWWFWKAEMLKKWKEEIWRKRKEEI